LCFEHVQIKHARRASEKQAKYERVRIILNAFRKSRLYSPRGIADHAGMFFRPAVILLAACSLSLSAQPSRTNLPLWPGNPPGPAIAGAEQDTTTSTDELIAGKPVIRLGNVSHPTLTLYPAPSAKASGAAVVIFPGGAYHILAMDLEGSEVAGWLNSIGVTAIVVKYRVPSPAGAPPDTLPLQDAQRSMSLVRLHAAEWHIDPHRIGVLGFSAGGNLAAALSTHYSTRGYSRIDAADDQSCRPDFAVLLYPAYLATGPALDKLSPEIQINKDTPPAFLLQAEDDPVHVENSLVYFLALKQAGVPAEMHIYAKGGHGYGLRPTADPITAWPALVEKWLHTEGVVK
jgi:acetyl esterase/lipase